MWFTTTIINFFYRGKTKLIVLCLALMFSCVKEKSKPRSELVCFEQPISYNNEIKPLIATYCVTNLGPGTGCHDAWIFDYNEVVKSINTGAFERVIRARTMPKIPNNFGIVPMSEEEIRKFQCWITSGALDN